MQQYNYTIDEVRDRFAKLPQDIQQAISSVETAEVIETIASKHHLHVDQTGTLAQEIGLVMLGFTKPHEFVNRIAVNLRVTQVVASQITQDINNQIFNPIKESLKNIHESHEKGATETEKTKPSDTETMFDAKLKGLFTSTVTAPSNDGQKSSDPYREAVE